MNDTSFEEYDFPDFTFEDELHIESKYDILEEAPNELKGRFSLNQGSSTFSPSKMNQRYRKGLDKHKSNQINIHLDNDKNITLVKFLNSKFNARQDEYESKKNLKLEKLNSLNKDRSNFSFAPKINYDQLRPSSCKISRRDINRFWRDQLEYELLKQRKLEYRKEYLKAMDEESLLFHPISYTHNYKNGIFSSTKSFHSNLQTKTIEKIQNTLSLRVAKHNRTEYLCRIPNKQINHMYIDLSFANSSSNCVKLNQLTHIDNLQSSKNEDNKCKLSENKLKEINLKKIPELMENKSTKNRISKVCQIYKTFSVNNAKKILNNECLKVNKDKAKIPLKTEKLFEQNQTNENAITVEKCAYFSKNEFEKSLTKLHILNEFLYFSDLKRLFTELKLLNVNSIVCKEDQLLSDLWKELNGPSQKYILKSHLLIFLKILLNLNLSIDKHITEEKINEIPNYKHGIFRNNKFFILKNRYKNFRNHYELFYLNRISSHRYRKSANFLQIIKTQEKGKSVLLPTTTKSKNELKNKRNYIYQEIVNESKNNTNSNVNLHINLNSNSTLPKTSIYLSGSCKRKVLCHKKMMRLISSGEVEYQKVPNESKFKFKPHLKSELELIKYSNSQNSIISNRLEKPSDSLNNSRNTLLYFSKDKKGFASDDEAKLIALSQNFLSKCPNHNHKIQNANFLNKKVLLHSLSNLIRKNKNPNSLNKSKKKCMHNSSNSHEFKNYKEISNSLKILNIEKKSGNSNCLNQKKENDFSFVVKFPLPLKTKPQQKI